MRIAPCGPRRAGNLGQILAVPVNIFLVIDKRMRIALRYVLQRTVSVYILYTRVGSVIVKGNDPEVLQKGRSFDL